MVCDDCTINTCERPHVFMHGRVYVLLHLFGVYNREQRSHIIKQLHHTGY